VLPLRWKARPVASRSPACHAQGRRPPALTRTGRLPEPGRRHVGAFRGHDGLHKYPGHARYRAVDAHDGGNAGDVMNRPNKRAPTRLMHGSIGLRGTPSGLRRTGIMRPKGEGADRLLCVVPLGTGYAPSPPPLGSWGKHAPSGCDAAAEGGQSRAAAQRPRAGAGRAGCRLAAGRGGAGQCAGTCTSTGSTLRPCRKVFERGPPLGGERADREVGPGVLRWPLLRSAGAGGWAGIVARNRMCAGSAVPSCR
jgi:hypothetical protein